MVPCEREAIHSSVSEAKYFAARPRMSRSVSSFSVSAFDVASSASKRMIFAACGSARPGVGTDATLVVVVPEPSLLIHSSNGPPRDLQIQRGALERRARHGLIQVHRPLLELVRAVLPCLSLEFSVPQPCAGISASKPRSGVKRRRSISCMDGAGLKVEISIGAPGLNGEGRDERIDDDSVRCTECFSTLWWATLPSSERRLAEVRTVGQRT